MNSVCVFCGSSVGNDEVFAHEARKLAVLLAEQEVHLYYGAGETGIMGVVAEAYLSKSGTITGVVPHFLNVENVVHQGLTELILVDDMAERKNILMDKSDAFIALPGGYGTMDELFEVLTAVQLGLFNKPIALLNTKGYFDGIINFLSHAVRERFLKEEHLKALIIKDNPEDLVHALYEYSYQEPANWIEKLVENNKF